MPKGNRSQLLVPGLLSSERKLNVERFERIAKENQERTAIFTKHIHERFRSQHYTSGDISIYHVNLYLAEFYTCLVTFKDENQNSTQESRIKSVLPTLRFMEELIQQYPDNPTFVNELKLKTELLTCFLQSNHIPEVYSMIGRIKGTLSEGQMDGFTKEEAYATIRHYLPDAKLGSIRSGHTRIRL